MTENITNNNDGNNNGISTDLLPNFCEVRNIFNVVLLTEVLAIIFSMAATSSGEQFWNYLSVSSMLMLWIALLDTAILCQLKNWLNRQSTTNCLLYSFAIMMTVSILVAIFTDTSSIYLLSNAEERSFDSLFLLRVTTISAVIYFLLLRYFYMQQQWRLNLAAQSRAEIQALRARIRPHFLFNSMNTIASLIEISPEKAELAIEDLSDLFRASLSEQNMSTLADEIELTKSYLAIEFLRLGERLQVEWDINPDLLDIEVPSLCIQPLAENAVYHGIEPLPEGGKISISALHSDSNLMLSVSNPLLPASLGSNQRNQVYNKGNQMAQDNIKQRLKLVYANRGAFLINDTKDQYTVSLSIPLDVKHERINS
jgi:two-component system sensor histidine kinase AlgZ